ncbi:hypothetical protein [Actinoplanes sp. GCM10030250]|uniref:hypothetical protein n=1 Tax=Actinoplanes sp. GCM10030250 TaxID=3273376 RepID=UPI003608D6E7
MSLPDPPPFVTRDRRSNSCAGAGGAAPVHVSLAAATGGGPANAVPPAGAAPNMIAGGVPNMPVGCAIRREPRPVPNQFGPAYVAERAWLNAAALRPGAMVAVSSADGGVGRSTLVAALGGLLALASPEPVIAVDMVPAPWNGLGVRVGWQNSATVWDAVRELGSITSRAEVEQWTQRGRTGLLGLVGETEGHQRRPPRPEEAAAVADRVRALFGLTLCDLPPAVTTAVWWSLAVATVPVLVARASTDSLRHTLRLLTCLAAAGYARTVRDCVVVMMSVAPSVPRQVRAVAQQVGDTAGAMVTVPYDPRLAVPEPIDARLLRRRTRNALVLVADAVLHRCAAERPLSVSSTEGRA